MWTGVGNRGVSVVPALLALSIVLFVCMIGAYVFNPGDKADSGGGQDDARTDLVDPTPYLKGIVRLEKVLFEEQMSEFGGSGRVAGIAQQLALQVRGPGTDPLRHTAYGRIFDWAGVVDARASAGYTRDDIPKLQREWQALRDGVFMPAEWFHGSGANLVDAPAPDDGVDPDTVRRLEVSADRLATLIRRGRRRAMAIPEASTDAYTSGAREATERWNEFARGWSESVDAMGASLPARPSWEAPTAMVMAHQELGYAVNELRNVGWSAASTTNIPFKYERENHFDAASLRLDSAREHLAQLSAP